MYDKQKSVLLTTNSKSAILLIIVSLFHSAEQSPNQILILICKN